uniref:ATP synthase complex subunit 8 n=1 Tax=Tenebrionoidea sp. 19 KM-2017 TaxID=2219474 RepID=A0A346RIZ6_9CUCU|nr:ATP synthase F0 subunit 8 [Tenebrionoidea sp. 19 KM-2017]
MPQMAPMNWLILMIYFIFSYTTIVILNFYINLYNLKELKVKINLLPTSWKW